MAEKDLKPLSLHEQRESFREDPVQTTQNDKTDQINEGAWKLDDEGNADSSR
jgi:hypothetical protein